MWRRSKRRAFGLAKALGLLVAVLAAASLTGCGDDGDLEAEAAKERAERRAQFEKEHPGTAEYGSPPLEFEADPGGKLAYTEDVVTALEGNVTLEFTNPQSVRHNLTVEAIGEGRVKTPTVRNHRNSYITVSLNRERKFIFYCSIPGHREAGMEGRIVVKKRF